MKIYTVFLLVFMFIMTIQRIWETFFTKKNKKGKIVKRWTFPILSTLHFIVGIGTIVEYFSVNRTINYTVTSIGFIMFMSAFILRKWAVKTLGDYHSIHIEIRVNHPLIKNGPYAYIRHPYYLSVIFELLGLPLIANAFFSFIFSLIIYVPFLLLRVYCEEKAMIKEFNDEYLEYKRETPGFLPLRRFV